ncbi:MULTISPECIES: hypothetical protein [Brucella]|uniref:hypothetical protein n=1 Tax=Brucella TaxID=234 RepID=UPI001E45421D|nr:MULTISPECIES: hypothetical protein [Brucella]UGQ20420.1 hypothetical protein LRL11_09925 [Brucella anthropi]
MTSYGEPKNAAFKTEHLRQTEIFAKAIDDAIQATGKQFEVPLINSVVAAIVMTEASVLASIADHRSRKALRKLMENTRPRAYAQAAATLNATAVVLREDEVLQ